MKKNLKMLKVKMKFDHFLLPQRNNMKHNKTQLSPLLPDSAKFAT